MAVMRDEKGRLTPGSVLNQCGRPADYRERVRRIRAALVHALTDDHWAELVAAQYKKAAQGDTDAFRALLSFLPQQVDLGSQDDNPLLSPDAVLVAILEAQRRLADSQALAIEGSPARGGTHPRMGDKAVTL